MSGDIAVQTLVRERLERQEDLLLAPEATRSALSRGRQRPEEPCPTRTAFQRDRDRIVHSKAFRRLKHKTQVFIAPAGDHYRTRLTHTLEVSQIARSIARAIALNEDLAEAIALGHDLGHTPFGHLGEDVLDECLRALKGDGGPPGSGFRHAQQSLRVVEVLEGMGRGLNLTWEVRDGILQHSGDGTPGTSEGCVVQLADSIAYLNHDIDDAVRAGILLPERIPPVVTRVLGDHHSQRINTMVVDVIRRYASDGRVGFSPAVKEAHDELERFMFEHVYLGEYTAVEREKAARLLKLLFEWYVRDPGELAGQDACSGDRGGGEPGAAPLAAGDVPRAVADYIAGMTDRFAIEQFETHYVPSPLRPDDLRSSLRKDMS